MEITWQDGIKTMELIKIPLKLIEENSLHDQKQQTSNINNSKKIYMALIRTVDVCF